MSLNWVMLSPSDGFVLLPGEQRLYQSPARTALSLQSMNKYPGREPFQVASAAGIVYLTSRRIVYLPAVSTPVLQSFNAPIFNIHDARVTAPFFGPNAWIAVLQPVLNGGIPSQHPALEMKLTFKDGGAFDFHTNFETLRERMQQAVEVARSSEIASNPGQPIDLGEVHLDELPAYDEGGYQAEQVLGANRVLPTATVPTSQPPVSQSSAVPAEAPPGYEEASRDPLAESLERGMRM